MGIRDYDILKKDTIRSEKKNTWIVVSLIFPDGSNV